jgi:tRNA dimethylallyltransferase
MNPLVVAVLGPTATGKSALALALAERFGGEIVNCDSTAVYRGFDIGTDKIAVADRRGIPHHLIDIAEPTDDYTAAQYAHDAAAAIRGIHARGRLPILAGDRLLLRAPDARPVSRRRDAALRRRLESTAERRGVVAASAASESGSRIGTPHSAARPEAATRALEVAS